MPSLISVHTSVRTFHHLPPSIRTFRSPSVFFPPLSYHGVSSVNHHLTVLHTKIRHKNTPIMPPRKYVDPQPVTLLVKSQKHNLPSHQNPSPNPSLSLRLLKSIRKMKLSMKSKSNSKTSPWQKPLRSSPLSSAIATQSNQISSRISLTLSTVLMPRS